MANSMALAHEYEEFHREPCPKCGKSVDWMGSIVDEPECPYCAGEGLEGLKPPSVTRHKEYKVGGNIMIEEERT